MFRRIVDCTLDDPHEALRDRRISFDSAVAATVAEIIEDVRKRGDRALLENAQRFDSPNVASILVPQEEIEQAALDPRFEEAIIASVENVMRFHENQLYYLTAEMETRENELPEGKSRRRFEEVPEETFAWEADDELEGFVGQRILPLEKAGVYVPGGKASYPSSVIMNVCPANVAMVREVHVTTPAGPDGNIPASVLFAARACHVTRLYKIGGAAAVAALALGTESIPRVDKIVGPGNRYVNEAKRQLWGQVGLDGYAGPSEVCVLADDVAHAPYAAADLLTQIEHAEDNAAFLVCLSRAKLDEILAEVEKQLAEAPRAAIMRKALANESYAFIAKDLEQAIEIVDAIAPEHLSIACADPEAVAAKVRNAGCMLLGEFTPESAADFALGPSHTLPTATGARFGSPVSVLDFLKVQSICRLTAGDVQQFVKTVEAFGEMEGLPTHGHGTTIRS